MNKILVLLSFTILVCFSCSNRSSEVSFPGISKAEIKMLMGGYVFGDISSLNSDAFFTRDFSWGNDKFCIGTTIVIDTEFNDEKNVMELNLDNGGLGSYQIKLVEKLAKDTFKLTLKNDEDEKAFPNIKKEGTITVKFLKPKEIEIDDRDFTKDGRGGIILSRFTKIAGPK